ncbi:pirin family protein [Pedobacter sandarakinus]|uniref:pirin family protein n=1 Tax=Pedobacter sandarakinus TaxID=353156 RepID=UPI0022471CEB|nr:hypothetical protein [Pedobacter sandarakinus]MCX2573320.1 hypothetical protein [Pedobacter sandarakinus]
MTFNTGKIYLADQRGIAETSVSKRLSTLSFEKYQSEDKTPIGDLFLCNDEFIAGGKMCFFLSKVDSYQIFIPINGKINLVQDSKLFEVEAGQVQVLNLSRGEVLEVSNPYANEYVNYLQLGLNTDLFLVKASEMCYDIDYDDAPNQLLEIIANVKLPFLLHAGRFDGENEMACNIKERTNNCFCFIVNGNFEYLGKPLRRGDAISLKGVNTVELKSSQDGGTIVVLEHQ